VKSPQTRGPLRVGRSQCLVSLAAVVGLVLAIGAPVQAQTVVGSPSSAGAVSPNNASGCNEAVCIYIAGSGGTVSSWNTTGYSSGYTCTHAEHLVNGSVVATSQEVCGGPNVQFSSTWNDPDYLGSGAKVCNRWAGLPGEPCERLG
jgi:hypothetical protein